MVNWIHFPKNKPLDKVSAQIVKAFEAVDATIDSYTHQLKSDEVLTAVRPGLEALGFDVEKSKKSDDLVAVPVLYGVNGKIEKALKRTVISLLRDTSLRLKPDEPLSTTSSLKISLRRARWSV